MTILDHLLYVSTVTVPSPFFRKPLLLRSKRSAYSSELRSVLKRHKLKGAEETLAPWNAGGTQGGRTGDGVRKNGDGTVAVTVKERQLHCTINLEFRDFEII